MYSFASKCKGSISLFLSIILLPTLTFTGLMVDSANLALSKSIVENAGELTTNAALANYDTVLKDVYGLMALSQVGSTTNDADAYFANTMQAKNLLATVSSAVSGLNQNIKDFVGVEDESYTINSNFLNVTYDSFEAKGVKGSSLRNYKILKNQIVEFMKYRGPAEIALDLFAGAASFEEADAKVDVTAAKTTVDATKGEMGSLCATLYKSIVRYDARVEEFKKAEKEWNQNIDKLNEAVRLANEYLVTWCVQPVDTSKLRALNYHESEKYEKFELKKNPSDLSLSELQPLKTTLESKLAECTNSMASLTGSLNGFESLPSIEQRRTVDDYFVFNAHLCDLMYCYNKINDDLESRCCLSRNQNESDDSYKARIDSAKAETKEWLDKTINPEIKKVYDFMNSVSGTVNNFSGLTSKYNNLAKEQYDYFYPVYKSYYLALGKLTGIDPVSGKPIVKFFLMPEGEYKQRGTHGNNYDYMLTLCNLIQAKFNQLKTDNNNLKYEVEKYGSNTGKDEYYQELSSEAAKNDVTFDINDLNELREQINGNKQYGLNTVAAKFREYNFYGKGLGNLTEYSKFKKACINKLKNTPDFSYGKYNEYYERYFPNEFVSAIFSFTPASYLKRIDEVGADCGGVTLNSPAFYAYLVMTFGGYKNEDENKVDSVTNSISEISDSSIEEVSKDENTNNKYSLDVFSMLNTSGGDLNLIEMDGAGSSRTGVLRMFSSMAKKIKGMFQIFKNGWSGLADNLLVTEYVFQNFSYATMDKMKKSENEGKDFQTTTLQNINKKNNLIYGCEIEYILEGYRGQGGSKPKWWQFWKKAKAGDGPEKNVKIVKSEIFLLRFVLNSIFAFTSSTLRTQTLGPATALSAACWGAIPVSVWQVILELVLSVCETSRDLSELMDGKEMPLYKSETNWFFQLGGGAIENVMKDVSKKVADKVADEVQDAAGSLINGAESYIGQMISGVSSDISTKTSEVMTKVGDELSGVINEQVTKIVESMGDVIKNKIEEKYLKLMTDGIAFNRSELEKDLNAIVQSFCDDESKVSEPIKDFLTVAGEGLVDQIMDSSAITRLEEFSKMLDSSKYGKSSDTDAAAISATDSDASFIDTKFTLNGSVYSELMNGVSTTINNYISGLGNQLKDKTQALVDGYLKGAEAEINAKVSEYGDKAEEWTTQKSEELGASVNTWLNDNLGNYTSTGAGTAGSIVSPSSSYSGGTSEQSSFVNRLMNFSYKDYLRIFFFLNIQGKEEEKMLTRIGDVIELNTKGALKEYYAQIGMTGHPAAEKFGLNNAYTYVEISANIHVKPLLLSQSIFAGSTGSPIGMWSYKYTNAQGY